MWQAQGCNIWPGFGIPYRLRHYLSQRSGTVYLCHDLQVWMSMGEDYIEAIARIGCALVLFVVLSKWVLKELSIVLVGYRAIVSKLSYIVVIPLFLVYPSALLIFFVSLLFVRKTNCFDSRGVRR